MTPSMAKVGMKDSGVSWVGPIPKTWDMRRTKFLFSLAQRAPHPEDGIVTAFRDGQVTLRSNRRTDGFTNALKEAGYQRVQKGDLVIHAMDAFAGAIGVSDSDGKCTPVYSCCVPSHDASAEFYARCVRTMATTGYVESLAKGIRERSTDFRWATFAEQLLPHPPKAEQDAIVAYLDRATSRIDAMVAKKTRFIELLREKRQVLITHAVTKGLDPNVPMKDSGVEWLGKVPTNWGIPQVKFVSSLGNGSTPSRDNASYWKDGSFPWLTSTCVNQPVVVDAAEFVTDVALDECHLPIIEPPAVLVGITGQGRTRGMATTLRIRATINQHMVYMKPRGESLLVEYLRYFIDAAYAFLRYESEGSGSTKGAITLQQIADLRLPLPNHKVQKDIVAHLDSATTRIDTLMAKTERSIELLREHRTALITAAVTGKLDLRATA